MGCYDTLRGRCPICHEMVRDIQSKGGDCNLRDYHINNAPADVLSDANRHPIECPHCHNSLKVKVVGILIPSDVYETDNE